MSSNKTIDVNECVQLLESVSNRNATMKLTIYASQAITNYYMYKRANESLLKTIKQEKC